MAARNPEPQWAWTTVPSPGTASPESLNRIHGQRRHRYGDMAILNAVLGRDPCCVRRRDLARLLPIRPRIDDTAHPRLRKLGEVAGLQLSRDRQS